MKSLQYQVLRVVLGCFLAVLVSIESPVWWVTAVPWGVICIVGIIAAIPILFFIGLAAGAAQADWMSDAFVIALLVGTPTLLAIVASAVISIRRLGKGASSEWNPTDAGQPELRSP